MAEEAGEREPGSIFRAQALAHHRQGRWTEVLPPAARPRVFRWSWLVLGVLGLSLVGLAAVPAPVYGAGSAVAVAGAPTMLVVVLPAADLPGLTDGAPVVAPQGEIRGTVTRHEPTPLSRAELMSRFGVPGGGLPDPAAVAVARLETGAVEVGSRYEVRVRVGSRSMLAGLPVLGRLVG